MGGFCAARTKQWTQASQWTKRVNSNNNHVPFNRTINILRGAHSCAGCCHCCCCCVYLLFKYCAMCRNGTVYRNEIQIIIIKKAEEIFAFRLSFSLRRAGASPFQAFMVSVFIAKCHTLEANFSFHSNIQPNDNKNIEATEQESAENLQCGKAALWINRQQWQRKRLLREILSILPCVKPQKRKANGEQRKRKSFVCRNDWVKKGNKNK